MRVHRFATRFNLLPLAVAIVFIGLASQGLSASPGATERVSVAWDGSQANGTSPGVRISADGRFVVFTSSAGNLVPNDTNGTYDVFVHDRQAGSTERVSVASDGSQGNGRSLWEYGASISGDGRFVTFGSLATNLVPGCGGWHIFLRDRQAGTTSCVDVAPGGIVANNVSWGPRISADGRFVVFTSWASNLVPNDTNGTFDVFVRDLETGATSRANVSSDGSQANGPAVSSSISGSGRFVAFFSDATNLVLGDTNAAVDAFVHDFQTGETERVSVAFDGAQGDQGGSQPSVSDDGRFVAFESGSSLVPGCGTGQIFLRDRQAATTSCASVASDGSPANNYSFGPTISDDGRFVVFHSPASNLDQLAGDTNGTDDVFVRDRDTDRDGIFDEAGAVSTTRASVGSAGMEANGRSSGADTSSHGALVAFVSDASNLVADDTNGVGDAYVHECLPDGSCGGPPPTPTATLTPAPTATPSDPELQLAQKFSPVLWMASDDYEPEEVQIMLDEPLRPNCSTELRSHRGLRRDTLLADCPTTSVLANFGGVTRNYIDIKGIRVGEEGRYRQQYSGLSAAYDLVTYADITLGRGRVVIDYWLFYYYDDYYTLDHEGDWERVQVVFRAATVQEALSKEPAVARYSVHVCDSPNTLSPDFPTKAWAEIEKVGTHPVAYVARGSHANYFDNGLGGLHSLLPCAIEDHTFKDVLLAPVVIGIDCKDEYPVPEQAWLRFMGRWGEWPGGPTGPCR